jgi:hypothetical protein
LLVRRFGKQFEYDILIVLRIKVRILPCKHCNIGHENVTIPDNKSTYEIAIEI